MSAPAKPRQELVGYIRMELLHGLVRGENTMALSRRLGIDRSAVTKFRKREAAAIEALSSELANEFTGLWIVEKRNRIAEYQRDVEQINDLLADSAAIRAEYEFDDDDEVSAVKITDTGATALMRTKARILRNVSEEMGQLPSRATVQVIQPVQVAYHVSGVDLGRLT